MSYEIVKKQDPEVYASMMRELERQRDHIELIASENFVSEAVLEAVGSHLTNKYAEGYPGARYYGGCQFVDEVETLAIERAKELFGAEYANVQPHSGAQANMAVFFALLGITMGVYVGSFTLGRRKLISVVLPTVIAALVTIVMYIGEMILLSGNLYRFGSGFLFEGLGKLVLAPIDIVVILASSLVALLICKGLNKCDKPGLDNNDKA